MKPINLCRYAAILALATLIIPSRGSAQTGPDGFWDFSIHGQRWGVALMEFAQDTPTNGTFFGLQIDTLPRVPTNVPKPNPRDGAIDSGADPRTGATATPASGGTNAPPAVLLFGGSAIDGTWVLGRGNRIFGTYDEVGEIITAGSTNVVTNVVSFTGSFLPGRRLVLRAKSGRAKILLRGLPAVGQDISGNYMGKGRRKSTHFEDTFMLMGDPDVPNFFLVTGEEDGSTFSGLALRSSNGRLALMNTSDDDPTKFSSLFGPFNLRRGTTAMRGVSSDNKRVIYKAARQISPP